MKRNLLYASVGILSIALISFKTNWNMIQPSYHNIDNIPFSSNPPLGKTGAPGEGSCVDCHAGSTLPATGVVTFSFSGTNNLYIPGQSYNITLAKTGSVKTGFEMTALDVNDSAAGDFSNGANTSVATSGGRNYIRHSASSGVDTWTFQWNAPAVSTGDVTFYYALNESNNSGNNQGDQIYLGSNTISEDNSSGVSEKDFEVDMLLINNAIKTSFYLAEEANIYFAAQDINGKQLDYHNFGMMNSGMQSLSIQLDSKYSSGVYLFTIFVDNQPYTTKIALP